MRTSAFEWFRRAGIERLLLGLLTAYAAAFLAWTAVGLDHSPNGEFYVDLGMLPMGLAAIGFALWAAATPDLDARVARAMRRLALAFACFWAGDLLWFAISRILGEDPYPSVADGFYLAFYPVVLWAVLSFPMVLRTRMERIKFWLDAFTVVVGGGMVIWYFLVGPLFAHATLDQLVATAVSIAYPTGDLVLLLAIAVTVLRRPVDLALGAVGLLFGSLLVLVGADLWFGASQLAGQDTTGGPADWGYLTFWLLAAWSCWAVRARHGVVRGPLETAGARLSVLPYASVATGYGLLLVGTHDSWDLTTGGLAIGAMLLTATVVARQAAAVRENLRLLNERATRKSEERFRSLVQNASDMIIVTDADLTIRYQTPSFERTLGYGHETFRGHRLIDYVHPDDVDLMVDLAADSVRVAGTIPRHELRLRRSDGVDCFAEVVVTNLLDNEVQGLVITIRDVDERKRLEEQLIHQAFHDPLTSLANRALFLDRVQHAISHAGRSDQAAAVVFLDLDNFKTVNDSLGHATGDAVLVEVARRLTGCTRPSDTVARFGGDEFAVLLDDGGHAAAVDLADRISSVLRPPMAVGTREVFVTVSAGVAVATRNDDADMLLRNADVAMYMAKSAGKARHEVYQTSMHESAIARLELEMDLRHALGRSEFEVRYQPIVELATGRIDGAEALIRWHHNSRGLLPPSEFIRHAEESGQIVAIGTWVLRTACSEAASWTAESGGRAPYVSVNLSARQLKDPGFADLVRATLAETHLPARRLVLEITESLLIADDRVVQTLSEIRGLGVRVAIDDFGTGYSSLSYLQRLPVDILKIDRSFVAVLNGEVDASPLARGIVELGRSLRLTTLAEGIETPAQAAALRNFGCEMAQGFHFAAAVDARTFQGMLAAGSVHGRTTAGGAPSGADAAPSPA